MAAEIEKVAVFASQIVQKRPVYGVFKGAAAVSNTNFAPNGTASQSQAQFNLLIPSVGVFVNRYLTLSTGIKLQMVVNVQTASVVAGDDVLVFGRDVASCAYPWNSLVSVLQAQINNQPVSVNSGDTLPWLLRLTDHARAKHSCPSMLDTYADYPYQAANSPLASYRNHSDRSIRPNGGWGGVQWLDNNGVLLSGNGVYPNAAGGGNVTYTNGVPVMTAGTTAYSIFVQLNTNEPLVCSPFIWDPDAAEDVGLFGVQNIQITANFGSAQVARVLRSSSLASGSSRAVSSLNYHQGALSSLFPGCVLSVQTYTPNATMELPAKSVVPYMEVQRFNMATGQTLPAYAPGVQSTQLQIGAITLPAIPDMVAIIVRPASYTMEQADLCYPIQGLSITMDNLTGVLASHTAPQLFQMSSENGLSMSWEEASGLARVNDGPAPGTGVGSKVVATVGGMTLLKFGKDIYLSPGVAPGLVGNYMLQLSLTCLNQTSAAASNVIVELIMFYSGYCETVLGSSALLRGILSEADIAAAKPAGATTSGALNRMVGCGFWDKMSNALGKASSLYQNSRPALAAAAEKLAGFNHPLAQGAASAARALAGQGASGAGYAGAGRSRMQQRIV